jgi:NAD(P)-dependent dehydrogenase (short-subunit alcohol dehydrogenase family)
MNLNLKDKVALVTGASQGIGRAIATRLAEEGMAIVALARNQERLQNLSREIESRGGRCLVYPADSSLPETAVEAVAATMKNFGRLDLLVNNAGATKRGDFLSLTEQDWTDGFALKFLGAVRLSRAAWPQLVINRGNIINIAGVGGRTGSAEFTIGGSVNAAMLNFTKSLSDRGVTDQVRVNAINPGYIRTDRLTARIQKLAREQKISEEAASVQIAKQTGIQRFGEPEEIASMVAFLASDQADYCQGMIIDIDGGMTRTL